MTPGSAVVTTDGAVGSGAVVPAGIQWTHADQTRNERGQFGTMPHYRNEGKGWFTVLTREKVGAVITILAGLPLKAAVDLCGMNGDGIAWTWTDSIIANALGPGNGRESKPAIPWFTRGPDVVLSHFNPRSRPPEGILVAMQTEQVGREVYLLGFYDYNEEMWMVLAKPGFHRQPMREPPLRWSSVEDAIRHGLTEDR